MEQIFNGYAEACQNAAIESKKQKDRVLYIFNKHIDGVKYALTDNEKSTGNLLQTYKNGLIYDKSKEPKIEEKPPVIIAPKEEPKPVIAEVDSPVTAIVSEEVKQSLSEEPTMKSIEQPSLNGTETKEQGIENV